jgi:IMP dehydrogenase
MDTVTEVQMAIAMAQAGGIGVIHRNLDPEEQAAQVRQVKKFESGMVVNPVTIHPEATLKDALALMKEFKISGIPVVERGGKRAPGKLVGILTNRDVRFATDPRQKVAELMTKERLVTVGEGVGEAEAKRLLHQHRIEKLVVVDEQYRCVGLITVKDIEQSPIPACRRGGVRLPPRPQSAVGSSAPRADRGRRRPGRRHRARSFAAGLGSVTRIAALQRGRWSPQHRHGDGAKALIGAGADAIKVGIGPARFAPRARRHRRPQLTAIMDGGVARGSDPVIADGGIKYSGDLAKARRGRRLRHDRLALAGTDETPGEVFLYQGRLPGYRGMGSVGAMARGSADRSLRQDVRTRSLVPEGVRAGALKGRPRRAAPAHRGLRAASTAWATWARTLAELHQKAEFVHYLRRGIAQKAMCTT